MSKRRSIHLVSHAILLPVLLLGCGGDATIKPPVVALAPDCAAMQKVALPHTIMKSAVAVPAGAAKPGAPELPAHCIVTGEINPRTGVDGVRYGNNFELRLPRDWNGRFQFMGVGGTAGYIPPAIGADSGDVPPALAQGYAIVTSDMGHATSNPSDASFGLDPQARIDWGYNAVDVVTVAAKELIRRYYGKSPEYSYFVGCSGGGRQAMMAALRNPTYFDGVVAGAPILEQHVAQIGSMQILQEFTAISPKDDKGNPILSRSFTDADFKLIDDAVVDKCDGLDGLRDGIIDNYPACTVDLKPLQCKGAKTATCLSAAQVTAMERVMAGPKNSRGEQLYPGRPWDTGFKNWRPTMIGTSTTPVPNSRRGSNTSIRLVFMTPPAPDFDYLKFDFDRDPPRMMASAPFTATNSTDWHAFRRNGGKAIVYAGIADELLNTNGVHNWYRNMIRDHGGLESTKEFVRYFHVPGMGHCRGGDSLDRFDHFKALVEWVEHKKPPEFMIATGKAFPGRTRPLCVYPKQTRYKGSGSIEDAANFTCQ